MLNFFRKYSKVIALILTVVVINMSIDAPDSIRFVNNNYVSTEDLSINEMESISEWVLEKIFGITNAVPEYDDDDVNSIVKVFIDQFVLTERFIPEISTLFKTIHTEKVYPIYKASSWYCVTKPVLKQPPKV